eukprot:7907423-Alexandrium_andersonii.AAC.1
MDRVMNAVDMLRQKLEDSMLRLQSQESQLHACFKRIANLQEAFSVRGLPSVQPPVASGER